MDNKTSQAYASRAADFATEWLEQPVPEDLQRLVAEYFLRGEETADVGCGAGRDTAWLNKAGYPTVGIEPVPELLALARAGNPTVEFIADSLPNLSSVRRQFSNIFCETVLMHLEVADIGPSVRTLTSLLIEGGIIYLSWRVTREVSKRDDHGRLYSAFDADLVREALAGMNVLLDEEVTSQSSGKIVHRLIAVR